jgi:hypothetical protein
MQTSTTKRFLNDLAFSLFTLRADPFARVAEAARYAEVLCALLVAASTGVYGQLLFALWAFALFRAFYGLTGWWLPVPVVGYWLAVYSLVRYPLIFLFDRLMVAWPPAAAFFGSPLVPVAALALVHAFHRLLRRLQDLPTPSSRELLIMGPFILAFRFLTLYFGQQRNLWTQLCDREQLWRSWLIAQRFKHAGINHNQKNDRNDDNYSKLNGHAHSNGHSQSNGHGPTSRPAASRQQQHLQPHAGFSPSRLLDHQGAFDAFERGVPCLPAATWSNWAG